MVRTTPFLLPLLMVAGAGAGWAQDRSLGILGKSAPAWELAEWYNLPSEVESLDLSDFEGKVLYVFCFQAWCPGCHSHGFPALKAVQEHFEDDDDVYFIAIQTVFEGFSSNTASRGRGALEDFELDIPLAQDEGDRGPSSFMRKYRTGGTPWTIIIDPQGKVRLNGFQVRAEEAITLIDRLRPQAKEPEPRPGKSEEIL